MKWLAAIGASLIALLQIVTLQRDKARQAANQQKARAEAAEAIREAEQRIAQAQAKARQQAEQVQHEIESSKGERPTDNFGDSRIGMRNNKD